MERINWRAVLLVAGVIFLLAYRRALGELLSELRIHEMWREFCGSIWAMPSLGRFTLIVMVMALLYVTAYFLVLNRRQR